MRAFAPFRSLVSRAPRRARALARLAAAAGLWACAGQAAASIPPESLCAGAGDIWVGSCGPKNHINGGVILTPDPNWKTTLANSPGRPGPPVGQTAFVHRGKKVWALTFIGNTGVNARGESLVLCDLELLNPKNKIVARRYGAQCVSGKPRSDGNHELAPTMVFEIHPKEDDMKGQWTLLVTLHDKVSGKTSWMWVIFGVM